MDYDFKRRLVSEPIRQRLSFFHSQPNTRVLFHTGDNTLGSQKIEQALFNPCNGEAATCFLSLCIVG
jgi:hypothetical protein